MFGKKHECKCKKVIDLGIPKGWMVHQLGQDIVTGSWYCMLVNIGLQRQEDNACAWVGTSEERTVNDAVRACVGQIERGDIKYGD